MRSSPASLFLAILLAACGGDESAPQDGASAAAPPSASDTAPRERAEPPRPAALPATIDGDLGGWTPAAEDLAFAARLAGEPEVEGELDALDPERRIAVLRAGLRLEDPVAARRAAFLVDWDALDAWELDRAASLRVEAILDPEATEIDGDTPTLVDLFEFGRPDHFAALLAGVATREADGDRLVGLLDAHKIARGEHVAALAALRSSESWDSTHAAVTAWVLLNETDVPDDVVFPLFLGRDDPTYAERHPPGTSAVAMAVEILLRPDTPKELDVLPPDRRWAWRRLGTATPVASDVEPLARLFAAPRHEDDPDVTALLLLRLGTDAARGVLRETVPDNDHRSRTVGWIAALAAIGDEEAKRDLRQLIAAGDGRALRSGLAALPAECAAQVEEIVLGLREEGRRSLPWSSEAFDPGVPGHVLAHDPTVFAGLGARAVERGAPSWVLARLARDVPACRTQAVVEAALARAERPDDLLATGNDCWLIEELAPYEIVARPALVAWLRRFLRDEHPFVRELGLSALVRLGDPESAAELFAWNTNVGRSDTEIVAFARSDGPAARKLVEERVSKPEKAGSDEDRAWITCLAVMHGLPEEVEVFGADGISVETLTAVRAHVLAGRWIDALLARLDALPDKICENVGSVRDPRVLAWLRRLRDRRTAGLTWWATAELARAGDEAARREHEAEMRGHRYRSCEDLTWRQRSFDNPLAWTPFWIQSLAANCCELACVEESFFEDVYVWEPMRDYRLWTPAEGARAWWARNAGNFTYSRVAGRWVPTPR